MKPQSLVGWSIAMPTTTAAVEAVAAVATAAAAAAVVVVAVWVVAAVGGWRPGWQLHASWNLENNNNTTLWHE